MHKRLLYLLAEHHELFLPEVIPVWEALERRSATSLDLVRDSARLLLAAQRPDLAEELLTRYSRVESEQALDLAEAMVESMEARSRVLFGVRETPEWRGPEILW